MADESEPKFTPGPLDELVPGLRSKAVRIPLCDVHPRVVQMARADGSHALVAATWRAAESAEALHAALRPVVEAALLAELSRPCGELRDRRQHFSSLQFVSFAPYPYDPAAAIVPFGLLASQTTDTDRRAAAALLRREAAFVDGFESASSEPVQHHSVTLNEPADPRAVQAIEAALQQAPDEPWGSTPGQLSRLLADALAANGIDGIEPSHAGITRLEQCLRPAAEGGVRWMGPLAFQALCDLLAVAAQVEWGMNVQWGVCDPDEDTGLAPPPLIKAERPGRAGHVPLGEHVLRWCIMPRRENEEVPSLADWAAHEFGE